MNMSGFKFKWLQRIFENILEVISFLFMFYVKVFFIFIYLFSCLVGWELKFQIGMCFYGLQVGYDY